VAAVVLILAIGLVFVAVLGYLGVAVFFAEVMTRSKRRRVQGTPDDLGLRFQDVQFLTSDRLTLNGWFMESPGARATVILIHDRGGTRADAEQGLLQLQADYVRRGFNVFGFDLRGRGESSGRRDHLGATERLDVQAALAYVRRRAPQAPIVLHGFGFGAALAIEATPRASDVAGVIADSPIASMRDLLAYEHRRVPDHLFVVACWLARRLFGGDADALAPIDVVDQISVPVLFIHAQADDVVPESHTLNLAAASLNDRHVVWVHHDFRGHCAYYQRHPREYLDRCMEFIDRIVPARLLSPLPAPRTMQAG
jgi:alpha/beta superfamily hydrolase